MDAHIRVHLSQVQRVCSSPVIAISPAILCSNDVEYVHVTERVPGADHTPFRSQDRPDAVIQLRCRNCAHSWKTEPLAL